MRPDRSRRWHSPKPDAHEVATRAYREATAALCPTPHPLRMARAASHNPNPLERLFQHIEQMKAAGATREDVRALEVNLAAFIDALYEGEYRPLVELFREGHAEAARLELAEFDVVTTHPTARALHILGGELRREIALEEEMLAQAERDAARIEGR